MSRNQHNHHQDDHHQDDQYYYHEDDYEDAHTDQFRDSTQRERGGSNNRGSLLTQDRAPSASALMANRMGSASASKKHMNSTTGASSMMVIPGQDTTPGAYSVSREGDSALLPTPQPDRPSSLPTPGISPVATMPASTSLSQQQSPPQRTNQQLSRRSLERKLDQAEAQFMNDADADADAEEQETALENNNNNDNHTALPPIGMMALPSDENIIIQVDEEQPASNAQQQQQQQQDNEANNIDPNIDDDKILAEQKQRRRRRFIWGGAIGTILVAVLVVVIVVVVDGGSSDGSSSSSSSSDNTGNNGDNSSSETTTVPATTTVVTAPTTTTSTVYTIFEQGNLFGCPNLANEAAQCVDTTLDLRGSFDIPYDTTQLTIETTTGLGGLILYVQRDIPPFQQVLPQEYACSDTLDRTSTIKTCTITPAIAGTYHYLLRGEGEDGFAEVTLRATAAEVPPPTPANDLCASASFLGSLSGLVLESRSSGNTNGATPEPGTTSCGIANGYAVWYSFVAGTSGTATVSLCGTSSDYNTHVAVFSGNSCDNLQCEAQNSDNNAAQCSSFGSQVSLSINEGTTYFVAVSGVDTAKGAYNLHVSLEKSTLETTNTGVFDWDGNMFDIAAKDRDIWITQLSLLREIIEFPASAPDTLDVEVYTKTGNYSGFEGAASQWTLLHSESIATSATSSSNFFPLSPFSQPLRIPADSFQAFYVRMDGVALKSTKECCEGDLYTENSDLAIFKGNALNGKFGNSFSDFVWNGVIEYYAPDP